MTSMPEPRRRRGRPPLPVASFGPELMTLLLSAVDRVVTIPIRGETADERARDTRTLRRLHVRLNTLRARMREEGHPKWRLANQVMLTWSPTDGLTLRPTDSDMHAILQRAEMAPSPSSTALRPAPVDPASKTPFDPLADMPGDIIEE